MSAHSKGPWQVGITSADLYPFTVSADDGSEYHRRIAVAVAGPSAGVGEDAARANTRLIAAAPELLEALEKIAFVLPCEVNRQKAAGSHGCDCLACDLVRDARIAISKARGEGEP